MMTEDQILEYINEHEPIKVSKCPVCGRWERREWDTGLTTIIEEYTYKNPPQHRQSFAVGSVIRKEVPHG